MKRLTIARVARASLIANRRGYRALKAGIFCTIFLISAVCMCAYGIYLAQGEKQARKLGYAEMFTLNDGGSDEDLRKTGLFDQIGHIYVEGCVEGTSAYIGHYDAVGDALMNRWCVSGRLPERAGEIAVERSVIESLRLSCEPGDTVALSVAPIDGIPETREYVIVGLLSEQSVPLSMAANNAYAYTSSGTYALPGILTSGEDEPFMTGRFVTHRALTLAPLVTLDRAFDYADSQEMRIWFFVGVTATGITLDGTMLDTISEETGKLFLLIVLLGVSLILSTCVGISSAMEGQLARKTDQIGMLRAVGATRRQIRRIFGREAFLLALILSPAALLAACVFCFVISRLYPDQLIFAPAPSLLIPILLFGVLCIALSSALPLRRAACVMPMSVIKDTALLRKMKAIKGKSLFRVPRLIAWRQTRLHPTRYAGAALLMALMLLCTVFFSGAAVFSFKADNGEQADFRLVKSYGTLVESHVEVRLERNLSPQDLDQIAALPGVERVETTYQVPVNLVLDELPAYYKYDLYQDQTHLLTEEEYVKQQLRLFEAFYAETKQNVNTDYWRNAIEGYNAARDAFSVSRDQYMVNCDLVVCAVDPEALTDYVSEGKIDIRSIDAGREIIAYAPDIEKVKTKDDVYLRYYITNDQNVIGRYRNDAFHAGQSLSLIQAIITSEEAIPVNIQLIDYASAERHDASVFVGAVVKGRINEIMDGVSTPCLITTVKGARAMGLNIDKADDVSIYVFGDIDRETEAYVSERIKTIAMRGESVRVTDNRENARENARYAGRMISALAGITVLFFAVSVSMITGGVTRRIRADQRMIGTLRAVGADARSIAGCYARQIVLSVSAGFALGLIGWGLIAALISFPSKAVPYTLACVLLFSGLCLLFCLLILNMRVRETMRMNIVENIREL